MAATQNTETKNAKAKGVVIAGTVSPEMKDAVEEFRWPNRMTVADVVVAAVTEYLETRGVKVAEPVAEVSDDADKGKSAKS